MADRPARVSDEAGRRSQMVSQGQPLTPFQQAVAAAVRSLEPGDLATYDEIAIEVGRPGSAQAVANVLRHVEGLPWWRVIPSDGRLYRTHAPVQRPLLEAEGIHVDQHRRVLPPA